MLERSLALLVTIVAQQYNIIIATTASPFTPDVLAILQVLVKVPSHDRLMSTRLLTVPVLSLL